MNTKPIIAWRILCAGEGATDVHGYAPMIVSHASGHSDTIDLKLDEYKAGTYQDGRNMVHISTYVDRKGQWYIVGSI